MTKAQFDKKVKAALKTGEAKMPDGDTFVYHNVNDAVHSYYAVYDRAGNCVDTAYSPLDLFYLFA